ncbi:hypothetical protein CYMTET_9432, partial [Cymbomonas tetramitiformis]
GENVFKAPEQLRSSFCNKVDVYGWGMTVMALWLAESRQSAQAVIPCLVRMQQSGHPPQAWCRKHPRLAAIISRSLIADDNERPSAAKVFQYLAQTEALWSDARFLKLQGYVCTDPAQGTPARAWIGPGLEQQKYWDRGTLGKSPVPAHLAGISQSTRRLPLLPYIRGSERHPDRNTSRASQQRELSPIYREALTNILVLHVANLGRKQQLYKGWRLK